MAKAEKLSILVEKTTGYRLELLPSEAATLVAVLGMIGGWPVNPDNPEKTTLRGIVDKIRRSLICEGVADIGALGVNAFEFGEKSPYIDLDNEGTGIYFSARMPPVLLELLEQEK